MLLSSFNGVGFILKVICTLDLCYLLILLPLFIQSSLLSSQTSGQIDGQPIDISLYLSPAYPPPPPPLPSIIPQTLHSSGTNGWTTNRYIPLPIPSIPSSSPSSTLYYPHKPYTYQGQIDGQPIDISLYLSPAYPPPPPPLPSIILTNPTLIRDKSMDNQ